MDIHNNSLTSGCCRMYFPVDVVLVCVATHFMLIANILSHFSNEDCVFVSDALCVSITQM